MIGAAFFANLVQAGLVPASSSFSHNVEVPISCVELTNGAGRMFFQNDILVVAGSLEATSQFEYRAEPTSHDIEPVWADGEIVKIAARGVVGAGAGLNENIRDIVQGCLTGAYELWFASNGQPIISFEVEQDAAMFGLAVSSLS